MVVEASGKSLVVGGAPVSKRIGFRVRLNDVSMRAHIVCESFVCAMNLSR